MRPARNAALLGGALLFGLGGAVQNSHADLPQKQEQVVYSIVSCDGSALQSMFATERSEAIYLVAGVDSFVSADKTLVYYWPITRQWKTDSDTLNVPLMGSLVISGRQRRVLSPVEYTYRSETNPYGTTWKCYTAEAARREASEYKSASDALAQKVIEYTNQESRLDAKRQRLLDAIRDLVRTGKNADAERLVAQYNSLVEPEAPPRLGYEVRPIEVAFDLNLPPGDYSIHIEDPSGATLEGSGKRLVVFSPRRTGAVGYDVIPGDRWTHTEESSGDKDVLYLSGASDLYLRPFEQAEFNDLDYGRMIDNQSIGSPRSFRWVRNRQIGDSILRVRAEGAFDGVEERPYFVQQAPGASLGYQILPFDESQPDQQGHDPSLVAFHIPNDAGRMRLYLSRPDGTAYAGSEREIRVVRRDRDGDYLLLLALLPLAGLIVPLLRRLKIGRE